MVSATNVSRSGRKLAYFRQNIQTSSAFAKAPARQVPASWRCSPRRRVPSEGGSRLTKRVVGGFFLVQSGLGSSSAFFKLEGNVVNIGLGRGSALNTFNNNIVNFNLVPKP